MAEIVKKDIYENRFGRTIVTRLSEPDPANEQTIEAVRIMVVDGLGSTLQSYESAISTAFNQTALAGMEHRSARAMKIRNDAAIVIVRDTRKREDGQMTREGPRKIVQTSGFREILRFVDASGNKLSAGGTAVRSENPQKFLTVTQRLPTTDIRIHRDFTSDPVLAYGAYVGMVNSNSWLGHAAGTVMFRGTSPSVRYDYGTKSTWKGAWLHYEYASAGWLEFAVLDFETLAVVALPVYENEVSFVDPTT